MSPNLKLSSTEPSSLSLDSSHRHGSGSCISPQSHSLWSPVLNQVPRVSLPFSFLPKALYLCAARHIWPRFHFMFSLWILLSSVLWWLLERYLPLQYMGFFSSWALGRITLGDHPPWVLDVRYIHVGYTVYTSWLYVLFIISYSDTYCRIVWLILANVLWPVTTCQWKWFRPYNIQFALSFQHQWNLSLLLRCRCFTLEVSCSS